VIDIGPAMIDLLDAKAPGDWRELTQADFDESVDDD
jgi:hypothetical protein